jgi:CheY-like chemotaxis protein
LISWQAFAHHVREALENFHDPVRLQINPLSKLMRLQRAPGETLATPLRELLRQTIESLRPPTSLPPSSPEWAGYRLLWLRYVQSRSRYAICEELGLSQASYYRRLQEAVDAVTSILWEQYQRNSASGSEEDAGGEKLSPQERAVKEAVRLARESPRELVPLAELLESVKKTILPLAEQQKVLISIETPPDLPSTYGDPSVLRQIILNVLTEGITLAGEGGLRLLVARCEEETLWRLEGLISPHNTPGAKLPPAGNRLMISQKLLEVYGGRLWLEHDEQGAPLLAFTVPITAPTRILIIDDDEDTINLYQRYLQPYDYVLAVARNKEQLEAQLAEALPDLILLDVLMPRWDGWMILQQLKMRPETASIPVVICSVLSQPRLALALGAEEVLQKPIGEPVLLKTIQEILARADSKGPGDPKGSVNTLSQ